MAADRKSAVLTININDNLPATEAETNDATYRSASAMIDSDDEFIRELTQRALAKDDETEEAAGADDLMQKAETLRKFVRRHISKKDMGTGFASASETAKTRTGDCSEHGVLLAAMLRAAGIPARVTTGLIYADAFEGHRDIFGWHMWTQALIDGKWVDFDATLPRRYNAVHVLTSVSSLRDGMSSADLAPVMQLLGNIEIEVLEVEHE
jgi:transglutaminase-like putative cysteine protease